MNDLHLIFLAAGIFLFILVVSFSYLQQRKSGASSDKRLDRKRARHNIDEPNVTDSEVESTSEKLAEDHKEPVSTGLSDLKKDQDDTSDSKQHTLANKLKNLGKDQRVTEVAPATESSVTKDPAGADEVSDAEEADDRQEQTSAERKGHQLVKVGDTISTELVAKVLNPDPVEQHNLLALFREHDFKFQRAVHIYGLNELTDLWRDIELELSSARFLELGISIQLCDQDGAMTQRECHDFQQMVYQFSERFDAPFEFSMDLDSALAQAQSLDRIARRYDSMAVLNVVPKSKSGFRMADIQSCARDLMMSTDKNGIFLKTEGQKNNITVLYRLACTDGDGHFGVQTLGQGAATPVHDLVMYLKVPATPNPEPVFQQMVSDANDLATWLDGKMVDRSGKAMTQRTYSELMQQISDIAYSMNQDGLTPGDQVTKKLF